MTPTGKPAFRAYTAIKREGQNDFWLSIGAAFRHNDGEGLNIVLQALPLDGRIILRLPSEAAEEGEMPLRRSARR